MLGVREAPAGACVQVRGPDNYRVAMVRVRSSVKGLELRGMVIVYRACDERRMSTRQQSTSRRSGVTGQKAQIACATKKSQL